MRGGVVSFPHLRPLFMPSFLTSPTRLFILALTCPVIALAQVSLSVNAGQTVRTVDERVFGVNAVMWDGQTGTAQTISLAQSAGIRAIRVPGGSLSDNYHWRNHTIHTTGDNWPIGFPNFISLITGLNSQAFVTVNYGSGTPEEAAAWVAYANSAVGSSTAIGVDSKGYDWKTAGYWSALRNSAPLGSDSDGMNFLRISRASPMGIKYWEIGNENYGSWETDIQAVKWDPYTYAVRAKDYITKMKSVDPTIKIGVVVQATEDDLDSQSPQTPLVTNPRTNVQHKGWTPRVLANLKTLGVTPDYVIYHRYEQAPKADAITWGGAYESDAALLQKANTWPTDAANIRQMITDYLGASGAGVEVVVTENNSVYAKPGKQTTSLVNGLFLADSIGNVLQTEINGLVWWDLRNGVETGNNNDATLYGWRNYGDYGIIASASSSTTAYDPYPTYYMMKLLSRFARGGDTVVSASSNNTLLSIFSVKRADGSLSVLVINKNDPRTTAGNQTATITLNGFTPASSATVYSYGVPQDTAGSSADITTGSMSISGSTFSASFAPYSATVISLSPAAVNVVPAITSQPSSQSIINGNPVVFTAVASGTPSPTYQWQRLPVGSVTWVGLSDGGGYSGSATATLTISSVTPGMSGDQFRCIATNSAGSATSDAVTLSVIVAPSNAVISITVE